MSAEQSSIDVKICLNLKKLGRIIVQCTVCPISSDPIYIVTYIKGVTTSWTRSKNSAAKLKYLFYNSIFLLLQEV